VSLCSRADVVDALSVGLVLFFQPDDTIESASAACPQLFRINPDGLVGLNGRELVRTGDRDRALCHCGWVPDVGDRVSIRFRVNHPSGRTV